MKNLKERLQYGIKVLLVCHYKDEKLNFVYK